MNKPKVTNASSDVSHSSAWQDAEQFANQSSSQFDSDVHAIDALVTDLHWQLYKTALRILSPREHSQHELQTKLQAKYPLANLHDIDVVLAALLEQDYQSDERYAKQALASAVRKGKGKLYIQQKIANAKTNDTASELLSTQVTAVHWLTVASQARIKRFGATLPTDIQLKAKQYRFLLQRGFEPSVVNQVLHANYPLED